MTTNIIHLIQQKGKLQKIYINIIFLYFVCCRQNIISYTMSYQYSSPSSYSLKSINRHKHQQIFKNQSGSRNFWRVPNHQQNHHYNNNFNNLHLLNQQLAILQQSLNNYQLNSLQVNPVVLLKLVNLNLLNNINLNNLLLNLSNLLNVNNFPRNQQKLTPFLCFFVPQVNRHSLNSLINTANSMDYYR